MHTRPRLHRALARAIIAAAAATTVAATVGCVPQPCAAIARVRPNGPGGDDVDHAAARFTAVDTSACPALLPELEAPSRRLVLSEVGGTSWTVPLADGTCALTVGGYGPDRPLRGAFALRLELWDGLGWIAEDELVLPDEDITVDGEPVQAGTGLVLVQDVESSTWSIELPGLAGC